MNFSRRALLAIFLDEQIAAVRAEAARDPRPEKSSVEFRLWVVRDRARYLRQLELGEMLDAVNSPESSTPTPPKEFGDWARARLERELAERSAN